MKPVTPIINLQRTLKREGKIRLGAKVTGTTRDGKEFTRPDKLTEFRLTSANRAVLEHVGRMYGGEVRPWVEEPGQFEILTASSEIFVTLLPGISAPRVNYEYWTGGGCQRRCDGQSCEFAHGDTIQDRACLCQDREWLQTQLSAKDRGKTGRELEEALAKVQCKMTTRVAVQLAGTSALGVWSVESHGYFAATEFAPTIDAVLQYGRPAVVKLGLEPRESGAGNSKKNYVVPVIRLAERALEELRARGGVMLGESLVAPSLSMPEVPAIAALSDGRQVDAEWGEVVEPLSSEPVVDGGDAESYLLSVGLEMAGEKWDELLELCSGKGLDWREVILDSKAKGWKSWGMILAGVRAR
jgi:hypothetical protein